MAWSRVDGAGRAPVRLVKLFTPFALAGGAGLGLVHLGVGPWAAAGLVAFHVALVGGAVGPLARQRWYEHVFFTESWSFTLKPAGLWGRVETMYGRIVSASGAWRVTRAVDPGSEARALTSVAVLSVGPEAVLDALPEGARVPGFFGGEGGWDEAEQAAMVVLSAVLGMVARGVCALRQGWVEEWTRDERGEVQRQRGLSRSWEDVTLRPLGAPGVPPGTPWLEARVLESLWSLSRAPTVTPGHYRDAPLDPGGEAVPFYALLLEVCRGADRAQRWAWVLEHARQGSREGADREALSSAVLACWREHEGLMGELVTTALGVLGRLRPLPELALAPASSSWPTPPPRAGRDQG